VFETIISEGSTYIDWHREEDGESLWQDLLEYLAASRSPVHILSGMIDIGIGTEFATPDKNGWNVLFGHVLNAASPEASEDFEIVQLLLSVVDDIFARDCENLTMFERIEFERSNRSWMKDFKFVRRRDTRKHCWGAYEHSPEYQGSYQQDLLYCGLFRSGRHTQHDLPPLPAGPTFTTEYTPKHYRALLYLQDWDTEAPDPGYWLFYNPLLMLRRRPLRDKDRIQAPAFHEWNISDLLMMERRMEFATFREERVRKCFSEEGWSDISSEDETDDSDDDSLNQPPGENIPGEPGSKWSDRSV
jgi:hypothetical protein